MGPVVKQFCIDTIFGQKISANSRFCPGRIKRLQSAGVIEKFTIIVNDKVLGIGVKATIGISRNPQVKAEIHSAQNQHPRWMRYLK